MPIGSCFAGDDDLLTRKLVHYFRRLASQSPPSQLLLVSTLDFRKQTDNLRIIPISMQRQSCEARPLRHFWLLILSTLRIIAIYAARLVNVSETFILEIFNPLLLSVRRTARTHLQRPTCVHQGLAYGLGCSLCHKQTCTLTRPAAVGELFRLPGILEPQNVFVSSQTKCFCPRHNGFYETLLLSPDSRRRAFVPPSSTKYSLSRFFPQKKIRISSHFNQYSRQTTSTTAYRPTMSFKHTLELYLEHHTAYNPTSRLLIRLTSLIILIYTTFFTYSDIWLVLNLLHLTATTFWYLHHFSPRLNISQHIVLAFLLVNFILPYTILFTISSGSGSASPPSVVRETPPPILTNLSSLHSLTSSQIQYKDSVLADSIRGIEGLWCKSVTAVCQLSTSTSNSEGKTDERDKKKRWEKFLQEWKMNATREVRYREILGGSKYAVLEAEEDRRGGLWCDADIFCRQRELQTMKREEEAQLAEIFYELAQMLNEMRWEMIFLVTQHNAGLQETRKVYEGWVGWVEEILGEVGSKKKEDEEGEGWKRWSPFVRVVWEGRKRIKISHQDDDDTTTMNNSSFTNDENFWTMNPDLLIRATFQRFPRIFELKEQILSFSLPPPTSSSSTPHPNDYDIYLSTLLSHIFGNLTSSKTWEAWNHAAKKRDRESLERRKKEGCGWDKEGLGLVDGGAGGGDDWEDRDLRGKGDEIWKTVEGFERLVVVVDEDKDEDVERRGREYGHWDEHNQCKQGIVQAKALKKKDLQDTRPACRGGNPRLSYESIETRENDRKTASWTLCVKFLGYRRLVLWTTVAFQDWQLAMYLF
ncbi:uncharacterized protein MYCFIDRAFT_179692 [Pseudocercospora fijiensis CIRAD86]|uniref:Uncharacterized protein n=1 Tax=Pseudocercospora fijiensis (strain CIRAD86) TaxID=383855 RepID=M2ZZ93_PSEFD|nr:uncharacterized protein MYCFIDRAFT_179692 [Pseudocercospora fijiensis CIRAD86]EME77481.1 hypothetical protein MYCFIDRAFT_179692 [Pseudocercospora fijiensis CIRAD86]